MKGGNVSQTWQTVLLSLATSLMVSLITFILGLKSEKTKLIEQHYKACIGIYIATSPISKKACSAIDPNRGKAIKVERGLYSVEYYPPVKELKRSGDILFLKKKLLMKL